MFFRMKKIFKITSACLLLFLFAGCSSKKESPFCITYKVTRSSINPYEISITYRDAGGLITTTTTQKSWTKEVCLPPDERAFILATPRGNSESYLDEILYADMVNEEAPIFSVQIHHPQKTLIQWEKSSAVLILSSDDL